LGHAIKDNATTPAVHTQYTAEAFSLLNLLIAEYINAKKPATMKTNKPAPNTLEMG